VFVDGKFSKEWTQKIELFDKAIIEEAIEDGVCAGRGDSNDVADHEGQHHMFCIFKHISSLSNNTEQTEWKPAYKKND